MSITERKALSDAVMINLQNHCSEIGIKIHAFEIRDIMLPAAVKKTFFAAFETQKSALNEIEKARAETALLRKLTNTAKMLKDTPHLSEARVLHALNSDKINIVLDTSLRHGNLPLETKS